MKSVVYTVLFLVASVVGAQTDTLAEDSTVVYGEVNFMPQFQGGEAQFYQYIYDELEYPPRAVQQRQEGRIFVEFVVDKHGDVDSTSIRTVMGSNWLLIQEAERIIRESPKWEPGRLKADGPPVSVRMVVPIEFRLNKPSSNPFYKRKQGNGF